MWRGVARGPPEGGWGSSGLILAFLLFTTVIRPFCVSFYRDYNYYYILGCAARLCAFDGVKRVFIGSLWRGFVI